MLAKIAKMINVVYPGFLKVHLRILRYRSGCSNIIFLSDLFALNLILEVNKGISVWAIKSEAPKAMTMVSDTYFIQVATSPSGATMKGKKTIAVVEVAAATATPTSLTPTRVACSGVSPRC